MTDEKAPDFVGMPKIHRWSRPVIITEKIDGTNGLVHVLEDGRVLSASRTRYITPEQDNYGFAAWVKAHEDALRDGLGVGKHFGEWYGHRIGRGYGLNERRFALFNTSRWADAINRPACCEVVPVLWEGKCDDWNVVRSLRLLHEEGSHAVPGYMRPEGVVVFHVRGNLLFKKTFEHDEAGKGE